MKAHSGLHFIRRRRKMEKGNNNNNNNNNLSECMFRNALLVVI
jgi:hypothetical protein